MSGSVTLSFVIAAIGCAFAGLCYAEFAAMIPRCRVSSRSMGDAKQESGAEAAFPSALGDIGLCVYFVYARPELIGKVEPQGGDKIMFSPFVPVLERPRPTFSETM